MFSDKTIEEYQLILMRNPSAKVFAPLAEAYRKMGLLQQALEISERGVKFHPEYPSGLVAYGKVLFELKKYEESAQVFATATNFKKDNILAHKLRALSLIKINKYHDALAAYKYVLFLNPHDEQAQKFINNWEYLEASQYSATTFTTPAEQDINLLAESNPTHVAHFIEALMARNELERARQITLTSLEIWPEDKILKKQLALLDETAIEEKRLEQKTASVKNSIKKQYLLRLLRRVELAKQEG